MESINPDLVQLITPIVAAVIIIIAALFLFVALRLLMKSRKRTRALKEFAEDLRQNAGRGDPGSPGGGTRDC